MIIFKDFIYRLINRIDSVIQNSNTWFFCITLLFLNILFQIFIKYESVTIGFQIQFFVETVAVFGLILNQKNEFTINNIDGLSLLFLFCFNSVTLFKNYVFAIISLVIALIVFIWWIRKTKQGSEIVDERQFLQWLFGFFIGFLLIALKVIFVDAHSVIFSSKGTIDAISALFIVLSRGLVFEEFIFRGFIFGYFRKKGINESWTIVISAILWSLTHLSVGFNFLQLVDIFLSGLLFGFLVSKYKSLTISIGAHAGYNTFVMLFQGILHSVS